MVAIPSSSRSMLYPSVVNQTGPFPIDFPVFDGSGADLRVTLNGATVSGWTFSGDIESGFYGDPSTWVNGKIDFAQPISGVLRIKGRRSARRIGQYAEGRGVPARDHNTEYNILTVGLQEMQRDLDEFSGDSLQEAIDLAAGSAALAAGYATSSSQDAASAEASANAAIAAASSVINATYNTRSDAAAATVPVVVQYLRTAGFAAIGDLGGALYKRVGGAPSHPGFFQDAAGAYFELAESVIRPEMLGAAGNNVADDGPAARLASAVAKALGRTLHFSRSKTYRIASGTGATIDGYEILIDVSGLDVVIDGDINGVYTADDSIIIGAFGSIGADVALNANVAAQASVFATGAAHGCVAGDVIKIGSNAFFETDTNTREGELARIASVAGTTIALKTWLEAGYNTANSAAINKMTLVNSRISGGGKVRGFGKTPATVFQVGVAQFACEASHLCDITIENCNTMGHWARDCFGGYSAPRWVKDIESTGQGYGVAVDGATQDFTVFMGLFRNCGHAVTTSNSSSVRGVQRRIHFSHLKAIGSALRGVSYDQPSDAFDTHAGAEHVTFQNCISWSSTGSAFNVECARARIVDCEAYQPGADAIVWTNRTTRGGAAVIRGTKIWNPRGSARGIYLYKHASFATFSEITIADNQLANIPGIGIQVMGDPAGARTEGLAVIANKLRGISGARAIYLEWWDGALVASNQVRINGGTGSGIRLRDVTGASVSTNVIDLGGGTGDAIFLEAGAAGGSARVTFSGNHGKNGGAGSTGIRIDSTPENCSLAGNDFRGCTTEESIPPGKGHRKASYTAI